ncbi:MAG: tetratricopeptide repeat protein [Thermomicrobiales bacterium]
MASPMHRPAQRAVPYPPSLPAQPTPLIGREGAIAAARQLVAREHARLLTFTGPAGVGKTRLAIAVAAALAPGYPDGAHFVDLAPLRDPALVSPTIARALGQPVIAGELPLAALRRAFGERRLLLVLDNCEQVLPAAVDIADLLAHCPRLVILATSRAPLLLRWELAYPVPPLALPDLAALPPPPALAAVPAVALFLGRYRAHHPDFALDAETGPIVAEICHRLDGMPLAIELAAGRGRLFPPAALLDRLRAGTAFLIGEERDLPARQRTLRAAIGWSHDLLSPDEQALFRRLGVFVGGGDLDAVAAVCGDSGCGPAAIEPLIASLAEQNLVLIAADEGGALRCRLLEMVREYAAEQLAASGEAGIVHERHTAHFLALAEAADAAMFGPEQRRWRDRLERDHDNLRAAFEDCLGRGDVARTLRLAGALGWFWTLRGHMVEGRVRLDRALALARRAAAMPAGPLVRTLDAAARLASRQGDFAAARALFQECLDRSREAEQPETIVESLFQLGTIDKAQGHYEVAAARLEEALALADRWHIPRDFAQITAQLGGIALDQGRFQAAWEHFEAALAIHRRLGDLQRIARMQHYLGQHAYLQGDLPRARALLEEALAGFEAVRFPTGQTDAQRDLGHVAVAQGDLAAARAAFQACLAALDVSFRHLLPHTLEGVAQLAAAQGAPAPALALLDAAAALRAADGTPVPPAWAQSLAATRAAALARLHATGDTPPGAPPLPLAGALALARSVVAGPDTPSAAPTPPPAAPRPPGHQRLPGGLTARECEVLRLVAQGRTNREIAALLSLSDRTVARHLSNIFDKLNVPSRAGATAFALRAGIA